MATVHKKHIASTSNVAEANVAEADKKVTPESVSDAVQPKDTQPAKAVEPAVPAAESAAQTPATEEQPESLDPLTDFKEKMSEEEQGPLTPPKKNYMWPILFIFIVAIALLVGIFIYKQGMNKSEKINVVSLSPTPSAIPTPTVTVDLSKYEVKVLNGSEVDGEAGKQQANLEGEGFTISSIGNADKSDYTKTIIQAKKEVDQAYLDKLKSVLEASFVLGEQEELSDDADSDVIVVLGSETN